MKRHQLFALAAVALVACVDGGRSSGPNFDISDAAHGGTTPGFYFLPPMVPQPSISEQFNAFLQPLVRICPLGVDGSGADEVQCPAAPIRFTRTAGMGSETIRVNTVDRHYIVNWHTDQPPAVDPGQRYRIEIFGDRDGTVLFGFVDVEIAATGKEAKNITRGSEGETNGLTIGLVDGKTLPIKFFAGVGALGLCNPGGPTCAEAIVSDEEGGLVVAVNADGEAEAFADFPTNWAGEPITVKLERLPNTPGPLGAPEGLHQWPLFYEFTALVRGEEGLEDAGKFVRRVRIGVCNIDNELGDPDHPEDRSTISLGMGRGNRFRTLPAADAVDILGMCDGITLAGRSGGEGWRGWLARAAAAATDVFLPRPLHAARVMAVLDGGAGGSTDNFESPVGTVAGRPDLVVNEIRIFPTSPHPGDEITITAEIRNNGNLDAGPTFVTVDVTGLPPFERELSCANLDEGESPWTGSVAPDESCSVFRTVRFDATGAFTVTARADAVDDLATESNEENNTASIEFTVVPAGTIGFDSDRDGNREIYVMNGDGTAQTNLTNNAAPDAVPVWSPDGLKIAFGSSRVGNNDIFVMNRDGSAPTNLTGMVGPNFFPVWSPDGSNIAFRSHRDENGEIYVMNADGTEQTNLTNNLALDEQAAWSPNGLQIAFQSHRDGNGEIYVMNANGSGQTNLSNNAAVEFLPLWSPDGLKIAFTSGRDGNAEIYVMNADGSGQTNLTNNAGSDLVGVWSPDGLKIAFESARDGNGEIYVMNADGTGQTRLTNNAARDFEPAWSPDGSKIVFLSERDGNREVYVMNADGTGQTRLTNTAGSEFFPSWAPR